LILFRNSALANTRCFTDKDSQSLKCNGALGIGLTQLRHLLSMDERERPALLQQHTRRYVYVYDPTIRSRQTKLRSWWISNKMTPTAMYVAARIVVSYSSSYYVPVLARVACDKVFAARWQKYFAKHFCNHYYFTTR